MDVHSQVERKASLHAGENTAVRVLVLGPMLIEHDGRAVHVAGSHRRRLLALLASRPGQVVGVDVISDALWGEDPPSTGVKTIQTHVARLRASLAAVGRELIETTPGGYRLAVRGVEVDADRFERLVGAGHRRLAARDLTGAMTTLSDALAEWRDTPYAEFPDAQFAVNERNRLHDLHASAVEDLAEARLESGAATEVTAELERLVGEHPGRERAWGLLMRALYATGRQQEALVAYQRARRVLAESFGLDPGPELRDLERRVVEQDPGLTIILRSDVPAALRTGPDPFLGRAEELAWLTEAWQVARRGRGDLRVLLGSPDGGRTRLAAEVAALAAADHAAVLYVHGADDVTMMLSGDPDQSSPSAVVDAMDIRSRSQPLLIVVDDVEWASAATMETLAVLTTTIEHVAALLVLIANPAGGGPAVEALARIDPSGGRTRALEPLSDDDVGRLVTAAGVIDPGAVAAIVSVAAGRPGVAHREAAAWAEQVAGDRLHRAAAVSAGALAAADEAHDSVVDEVVQLVRARTRRHRLTSAPWLGRQPYRGLSAYRPADVDVFVGRERLLAELATRVLDRRLVILTGASGSGKSSLVCAGLIPLVQSGHLPGGVPWRVNLTVPGGSPLLAFDTMVDLEAPGAQLIVIDQFEEVFASAPAVVEAFAERLNDLALDPALDAHIVLVVRADQYGRLADTPHLTELVDDASLLVSRPSDDELRRIVEEPAVRAGCTVEPALTAAVLADVGDSDGILPLLSTALAELWDERSGNVLTLTRYLTLGGLAASVERLGAAVLDGEPSDSTGDAVRRALLLLADITDDGTWIRRRIHADHIPSDLLPTVDALVDGRLVVRDGDTVEIAHEIVFRAWPQLETWLENARADLVLGRDLRLAARAWNDRGRSDDDVYRGTRLASAVEWCRRRPETASTQIAEFVAAGTAVADCDRLAARAQLARERRAARRLRRSLVAASLLLVFSLLAAGLALAARRRADDERDDARVARADAERQRDDAQVASLVAQSGWAATRRLDLALLLAVEARRRRDSFDTRGALGTALGHAVPPAGQNSEPLPSSLVGFIATGLERAVDVDLSADGRTVAVGGVGEAGLGAAAVHDSHTRAELLHVEVANVPNVDLAESGRLLLVWGAEHADAYDIRGGAPVSIARRRSDGPPIDAATLSPDASMVAVLWGDGSTTFHDTATGDRLTLRSPPLHTGVGAFWPDGTLGLGVDVDGMFSALRWDVAAGRAVRTVTMEDSGLAIGAVFTVSPDLRLLVAMHAGVDGGAPPVVWDLDTGRLVGDAATRRPVGSRSGFVSDRIMAIGGPDGSLVFYDLATERTEGVTAKAHGGGIRDLWTSIDGRTAVSIADDGLVGVWERGHTLLERQLVADRRLGDVAADGSRWAVLTPNGRTEIVTLDGSSPPVLIDQPTGPGFEERQRSVSLSADGGRVFVGYDDGQTGRAFVADTHTGEPVWVNEFVHVEGYVENGDISPDGSHVFLELFWGTALTSIDLASGDEVAHVDAADFGEARFWAIRVSPDGRYVDAAHGPGVSRFDAGTLELITHVDVGAPPRTGFNPTDLGGIRDLAHVPGTNDVVAVGQLGRVYRVDMDRGELTATGQSADPTTLGRVGISDDGSIVAATNVATATVAFFDADTLDPISDPRPAGDGNFAPWFTPDGDLVGNSALGISERELDPDEWQSAACRLAGRNLTRAEWADYLGDEPYRATCPEWPPATG